MNIAPNWYEDGQHIEALIGTASVLGLQIFNSWRSVRNARGIAAVRRLISTNDEQIMAELETAQQSLASIRAQLTGDRRRPPAPGQTFAGIGRRATDPPPLGQQPNAAH